MPLFTPPDQRVPHVVDCTMFWSASGGGVRRYLESKRAWLTARAGWRHTIVAPGVAGEGFGDCGGWALPLADGYRFPLRRQSMARAIVAHQPDLIEVGDPYRLAWSALDAGGRLGVPTVAFCHSNLGAMAALLAGAHRFTARFARRVAGAYLQRVYGGFDRVLAPSASMTAELQGLGLARVEQQSLGVDTRVFHPARYDFSLRGTLGLPREARLLLYAGRFAPEKNLATLAEAVRRLGEPYVLLALGRGPRPPHGERVMVLPHESRDLQLARLMASVDVFVHAGDQETFGLAPLEAMACGTPVVVRAAAGLAELVGDSGAGYAVDSANPAMWAEAIAAIFTSDRRAAAAAARARAEAFAWERVMPALMHRYRRLMGKAAPLTLAA